MSLATLATASCRHGRVIMLRMTTPYPLLKSFSYPVGSDPRVAPTRYARRNMVAGRGLDRPENGITRRWAKRGTRPSAPKDQRTKMAYIYGAICPVEGRAAGLVLPRCNTEGMTLHLAGIAATIAPGAHAVLLLDQAGWHVSEALVVPPNITLLLPFKCPVLNWQEPSGSTCATTGSQTGSFRSYNDILEDCCFAWNRLVDQPWRIMSIGTRQWARAL